MSTLNGKGPNDAGKDEGRRLGKCKNEQSNGELGIGMGNRRHSGGGQGNKKRKKSFLTKKNK